MPTIQERAQTPFANMIAFQRQPGALESMSLRRNQITAGRYAPTPRGVPLDALAVEFQGLWFWGWN